MKKTTPKLKNGQNNQRNPYNHGILTIAPLFLKVVSKSDNQNDFSDYLINKYSFHIIVDYEQGQRRLLRSFTSSNVDSTEAENEADVVSIKDNIPMVMSENDARKRLAKMRSTKYKCVFKPCA